MGADGSVYFKANQIRQRGHGIGGIFGSIIRRILPFLSKHVVPFAKTALKNVAVDVLDGNRNLTDSLSEHGVSALKGVGQSILSQSGSGIRRKRKQSKKKSPHKSPKQRKTKKKPYSVFP